MTLKWQRRPPPPFIPALSFQLSIHMDMVTIIMAVVKTRDTTKFFKLGFLVHWKIFTSLL